MEKLLKVLENVVPDDNHLEDLDENDVVIGILNDQEAKINTLLSQLSEQVSERILKEQQDEVTGKLIAQIKMFREIQWYLIRDRLDQFEPDENTISIKKGFKVVLIETDPLEKDLFELLKNLSQ